MVWAPTSEARPSGVWPFEVIPDAAAPAGVADTVRFGEGVRVTYRDEMVQATWRGEGGQGSLGDEPVSVTVTGDEIRICVPAVWRAHAYLSWRDGKLFISSDLRTLAAAIRSVRPQPEGVALFLAGGRCLQGLVPSLYEGIWEVQAGHTVTVEARTSMHCRRTWIPERDEEFDILPLEAVTERLRAHLDASAAWILNRHRRAACLFSGGLDSTLVAAMLVGRAPRDVVLLNVGSGLGTDTEEKLRARFLREVGAVTTRIDLPAGATLVQSLRDVNAVSALPMGSLFAHVFEEIVRAAKEFGCEVVVTGDGGDEVFAEREEVLVDLLAGRSLNLLRSAGYFALRNGERSACTLRRAWSRLRNLSEGSAPDPPRDRPGDLLIGDVLAERVLAARAAVAKYESLLWADGWTLFGIERFKRVAAVPESEPFRAEEPTFAVVSPLAEAALLEDALMLRRGAIFPDTHRLQPKWLLRQAARKWLAPDIALHPKIGSADQQILARLRIDELPNLLDLLGSTTARSLGLCLPSTADDPRTPLWHGDDWVRAASLAAWFERAVPCEEPAPHLVVSTTERTPPEIVPCNPTRGHQSQSRPGRLQVVLLAALNAIAQIMQALGARRPGVPASKAGPPSDDDLAWNLTDLARRACAIPVVSGASDVMAQALAWYLRLQGQCPVVRRGRPGGRLKTRWWLEVGGSVVDVGGVETLLGPEDDLGTAPDGCNGGPQGRRGVL